MAPLARRRNLDFPPSSGRRPALRGCGETAQGWDIGRLGAYQFLQPAVVVLLAFIFLGETISLPMVFAAALIFAGVYVIQHS